MTKIDQIDRFFKIASIYLDANFTLDFRYFNQLHDVVTCNAYQSTGVSYLVMSGTSFFFNACELIGCVVSGSCCYTANNPILAL